MCYNCGCELPHDTMGRDPVRQGGPSLVEEDMQEWAKAEGVNIEDIKDSLLKQLGCDCGHPHDVKTDKKFLSDEKLQQMADEWGMSLDETRHNICHLLCKTHKH